MHHVYYEHALVSKKWRGKTMRPRSKVKNGHEGEGPAALRRAGAATAIPCRGRYESL